MKHSIFEYGFFYDDYPCETDFVARKKLYSKEEFWDLFLIHASEHCFILDFTLDDIFEDYIRYCPNGKNGNEGNRYYFVDENENKKGAIKVWRIEFR